MASPDLNIEFGRIKGGAGVREIQEDRFTDPALVRNKQRLRDEMGFARRRQAQQVGGAQIDTSQQGQFRNNQSMLTDMLFGAASGQGPSAAQSQLRQATDANIAAAAALSRSRGDSNAGLAARQAVFRAGDINQQMAGQAATLRAQEQLGARSLLADVIGQGRQQDLGLAAQQAGLNQQAALANQASDIQMQGINDRLVSQFMGMGLTLDQAQFEARRELEKMQMGREFGMLDAANQQTGRLFGQQMQEDANKAALWQALIGGAAQGVGLGAVSLATGGGEK